MIAETPSRPVARRAAVGSVAGSLWRRWGERLAFMAVLLLAILLNFVHLGQESYGRAYYAAGVLSMLQSWHNFFFVSFDPGGFLAVDKPPLGLWMQVLSAKLFGFSPFSLLLPEALAGVLSVAVLYKLIRGAFGLPAGLLAAATLALTPISVATNRNNTMDSLLVLALLLAAWAALRAAETGRLRWLLAAAVMVGLGFNIKMGEAFVVLPAVYLLYLVAPPIRWWRRLVHLAGATVVLLVVSLAWVVAVDLTPPSERPYVGSSQHNRELELAIGHNGLERFVPANLAPAPLRDLFLFRGQGPVAGQLPTPPGQPGGPAATGTTTGDNASADSSGPGAGAARPWAGGDFGAGAPGPLRLFNRQLGGQIGWLLPLAGLGLVVGATARRPRLPLDRRQRALLFWGIWLLTLVVFFSTANLIQRYYLVVLAPAIAALVGAGVLALWNAFHRPGWRGWLLPAGLIGTGAAQAALLAEFPDWSWWLTPTIAGMCLLAAGALVMARLARASQEHRLHGPLFALTLRRGEPALSVAGAAAGLMALFAAPTVWAGLPVWYGGTPSPMAGPDVLADRGWGEPAAGDPLLEQYLLANRTGESFLVNTLNTNTAAPLILDTGEPVMALGGFFGGEQILTTDELARLVAGGAVRFFLLPRLPDQATAPPGPLATLISAQGANLRWVAERCTPVPPEFWQSAPAANSDTPVQGAGSQAAVATGSPGAGSAAATDGRGRRPGFGALLPAQLYDCAGARG